MTKGNLEYQRPLWETWEIPKLNFLETELGYNSSKFSRSEWTAYSCWYFEVSQLFRSLKLPFCIIRFLRLTETKNI